MARYRRNEAREWTREYMRGVDCVIIPTYAADMKALNKAAIQHDVKKAIEFGFRGALLVADIAFHPGDYVQFAQWAHEAAESKLRIVNHASFSTLEENVELTNKAAQYCDYTLLCYPANFYPKTEQDVYDYTKAFCDQTDLGVMLFPVPLWNFGRLHPAQMSMQLLRRLVDNCPTVVAIKAEGDLPGIAGLLDVYRQFKDVIVSCPVESDIIPLFAELDFQYSGTNNAANFGSYVPRMFKAASEGRQDEAMDLFWKMAPLRHASGMMTVGALGSGMINRMAWKFMDWTMGMNGGPIRQPTARLFDGPLGAWRRALEVTGLGLPPEPTANFFIGRNPE